MQQAPSWRVTIRLTIPLPIAARGLLVRLRPAAMRGATMGGYGPAGARLGEKAAVVWLEGTAKRERQANILPGFSPEE